MAIDDLEAAIVARNIVTDRSPSAVGIALPHIQALIPTALEVWQQQVSKNPVAREILKKNISTTLSSGTKDLASFVNTSSNRISLKDLRKSTIYTTISGTRTPFTWVNSQQQLNYGRQLDADSPACFLDGYTLRTRNTDGSLTSLGSATIEFTVVDYPNTTNDIPDQLQESFILVLADLVSSKLANGN